MKHLILLLFSLFVLSGDLFTQDWRRASAEPVNGSVSIQTAEGLATSFDFRNTLNQLPGWPQTIPVNQYFKPFRGLALADLDNDDTLEVIASSASQITAFNYDGTERWTRNVTNFAQYCPSVADVNNDGWPEIVQVTRGATSGGRIYLLDRDGNDLPGWPVSLSNRNLAGAACLADVDGDSLLEIIVGSRQYPIGYLHILKLDGTSFSPNWPAELDHVPAVTAAAGDVDADGEMEIVYCSYNSLYVFNLQGQPENGWPVTPATSNFSYQSPWLADINGDGKLEIIIGTSGNSPIMAVYDYTGQMLSGWPKNFPAWSYGAPTAVDLNNQGDWKLFDGCQGGLSPTAVLFGFDPQGQNLPNFPLVKAGGAEGFLSIADVDGDGEMEILTDDNLTDPEGKGFIHAFDLDSGNEVPGFPLRPTGFTYMNGAEVADIDHDGTLDIAAVTYNDQFTYINVWSTGVSYSPEKILFPTYHGNYARSGFNPPVPPTLLGHGNNENLIKQTSLTIYPNPMNASCRIRLELSREVRGELSLYDLTGRKVRQLQKGGFRIGENTFYLNAEDLGSGLYFVVFQSNQVHMLTQKLILLK